MAAPFITKGYEPFTEKIFAEVSYDALGAALLVEPSRGITNITQPSAGLLRFNLDDPAYRLEKAVLTLISPNPLGVPVPKAFVFGPSSTAVDELLRSGDPYIQFGFENWTGVLTHPASVTFRFEFVIKLSDV